MNSSRGSRNSTPRGNQIFFWALTNDYASLKAALEAGVAVNVIDPVTTDSPLMIACRKGHTDIVRICLEYGAKNDPHPEFGQTALHACVTEQKLESARVLLEVAAESEADHIICNLSDPSGQTPLHAAAYIGSTDLVELLLRHGAELSSVDVQGQTALHLCASSGIKVCLAMLLDHGGDDLIDHQDNSGNTALHHATYHGRMDCVRLLLETAADVSIRNYEGYTAYNIASAQGHQQIGLLLLEYRDLHSSRAPSAPSSALPTPSKPERSVSSSYAATPTQLPYMTPQSSARYGPPGHGGYDTLAAHSPSQRILDYADDQSTESPERQVRLTIGVPQRNGGSRSSSIVGAGNGNTGSGAGMGSPLSLQVPINPMSSMYGTVGGLENIDSIGNFLPRPHTVNSPNLHRPGGLHAAALRNQHTSRDSPTVAATNYSNINPMRRSAEDPQLPAMGLTKGGVAAHNRRLDSAHGGNGSGAVPASPLSPTSDPGHLESGPNGNGYKVLPKQAQPLALAPPVLSRHSTESAVSNHSDPGTKLPFFDGGGIPIYTKSNIISTEHHQRRHSADSPSSFPGAGPLTLGMQPAPVPAPAPSGAGAFYPPGQQAGRTGLSTSHSSSEIDSLTGRTAHNDDQHQQPRPLYGGVATRHSYNNFMDHHIESIAASTAAQAEAYPPPTDSVPGPPQSTPKKSSFRYELSAPPALESESYMDAAYYDDGAAQEDSVEAGTQSGEYAEPVEAFTHLGRDWTVYYTDEQQLYYLDMANEHSQWEDPREFGIRYFSSVSESPTGRISEPPKSPSPKAMEKHGHNRSFHFNPHNPDATEEESPRVKDIKPIKLNWEARDSRKGSTAAGAAEYSSDSSDEEVASTVKVRYPSRRVKAECNYNLLGDDAVRGRRVDGVATPDREQGTDVLDLEHIAVSGEKLGRPQSRGESEDINNVTPADAEEMPEKGRIRQLASQFDKPGSKPLSPAGIHLQHTASFSSTSNSNIARVLSADGAGSKASTHEVAEKDTSQKAPELATARPVAGAAAPPATAPAKAVEKSAEVSRSEAEQYVRAIVAGKTVQEVSDMMDRDGRSQTFKLQALAWADEEILLKPPTESFSSPSSKAAGPGEKVAPVPEPVVEETIASLKEDAVLGKYAKMTGMGVPPGNVLMKMKMEGVEVNQRNRLMRAAGQELEAEGPAAPAAPVVGGGLPPPTRRPSASLLNLHWNTLPAEKLKNSIWAQNANNAVDIAEADLKELERLFGAQKATGSFATTRTSGMLAETQKEALQLKYLDKKRAQNIVIGLNPFKSMGTHVELLKALCSLNDLGGKITADSIDNFRTLLPTDAELKRIDKVKGSKHPAEMFFQAVMMFYPELPLRLSCFSSCLTFPSSCEALQARSRKLINACNQVLASTNLARLLQRMLAVGNVMNEGTRRGGASGFTLDSLLKMVNTKGVDKKTSVLDYVVKSLYDKQEESVLAVIEDLNLVDETARISGAEVMKEFAAARATLDGLEEAYQFNQKKNAEPGFTSPTAKKMIDEFSTKLEAYLSSFQGRMQVCDKSKLILKKKIDDVIQYFGEDGASCDTAKIFGTLQEFLRAVAFSKAAVEWRIYRSHQSND